MHADIDLSNSNFRGIIFKRIMILKVYILFQMSDERLASGTRTPDARAYQMSKFDLKIKAQKLGLSFEVVKFKPTGYQLPKENSIVIKGEQDFIKLRELVREIEDVIVNFYPASSYTEYTVSHNLTPLLLKLVELYKNELNEVDEKDILRKLAYGPNYKEDPHYFGKDEDFIDIQFNENFIEIINTPKTREFGPSLTITLPYSGINLAKLDFIFTKLETS